MPASVVLLIDLENMIGANARPGTLAVKLDALTAQAGNGVPAVAACAGNRITAAGKQALKDRKIRLLTVNGDKDAADKALLDEAGKLARAGCTRFLAASHDSGFAQLADLGQLEIIAWTTPKLAKNYSSRATLVHPVPRPATAAAKPVKAAAKPTKPAKARLTPAPGAPHSAAPAVPGPQASAAPQRLTVARAAAAGAGIVAAGILFGVGTVLGASACLRLLRQPIPAPRP